MSKNGIGPIGDDSAFRSLSDECAKRVERGLNGVDYDELYAAVDRAEMEAMRKRQAANRHAAYSRHRPTRYADASYSGLRPHQDPRGLIATWYERGPRGLLLAGPARTGKTYAAYAIANAAHDAGAWVVARSAADLSAAMKPDGEPLAYNNAIACDLLVIDDLGRERVTEWWLDQLQRIVDDRCGNQRRIVVTTNSDPAKGEAYRAIADRYGDPVAERILDGGGTVILDGPAVREVVDTW